MKRVLYVTSKWPGKSRSNDGGDSTIKEVIKSLSSKCTLDLLCFRDDKNDEISVNGLNKIFKVEEDFSNFDTYSDRKGEKFYKRIEQAEVAATEIRKIACNYHIIIVQHTSLILGLKNDSEILKKIVLFPMFTSASYEKSGEFVPEEYKLLEQKCIKNVYRIVTPSYVERDILLNDCNVEMEQVTVVPRSVGFNFSLRKKSSAVIRLVYVASVRLQKNHMAALRVVNIIKNAGMDVYLTCVGAIQDKAIYTECLDYIRKNNLSDDVVFVGNTSFSEIESIFSESDINISVSNWETFGRGIYEGMSTGLPTVIFDSLDCVLKSDNIGVYPVAVKTENQMATEIIKLASDSDYYERESKKGILIQKKLCFDEVKKHLRLAFVDF